MECIINTRPGPGMDGFTRVPGKPVRPVPFPAVFGEPLIALFCCLTLVGRKHMVTFVHIFRGKSSCGARYYVILVWFALRHRETMFKPDCD